MAEENQAESNADANVSETPAGETGVAGDAAAAAAPAKRAHRSQKVGAVVSDKMQKTVVVRVDRLVRHTKYRRYVRRTSKFMAHDEMGATIGDKVRIVETRPMSARKRWRVIEIVQKAAK
jgi:small subunit ribosomal protein S17